MPKPAQRTRSRKRVCKALPGGRTSTHFKLEVTATSSCSHCSKPLTGVPRLSPSKMGKLNRTRRRIWRIYGGQLCHNCLKAALKQAARTINAA
ncbi:MAG: 50S ribosomal protein L34e [Candidatus Bathyarchaeales archaeon]